MKHIEINVIQFLLMIIFIFLFTYLWIPKINIHKTIEYKKLAVKYLDLLDEKTHWQNLYTQCINPTLGSNINTSFNPNTNVVLGSNANHAIYQSGESSIGTKTSAHSSAITPRNIESNDNALINQFFY